MLRTGNYLPCLSCTVVQNADIKENATLCTSLIARKTVAQNGRSSTVTRRFEITPDVARWLRWSITLVDYDKPSCCPAGRLSDESQFRRPCRGGRVKFTSSHFPIRRRLRATSVCHKPPRIMSAVYKAVVSIADKAVPRTLRPLWEHPAGNLPPVSRSVYTTAANERYNCRRTNSDANSSVIRHASYSNAGEPYCLGPNGVRIKQRFPWRCLPLRARTTPDANGRQQWTCVRVQPTVHACTLAQFAEFAFAAVIQTGLYETAHTSHV